MDAHGTVTAEEGDRYPLGPPSYLSVVKLYIITVYETVVLG